MISLLAMQAEIGEAGPVVNIPPAQYLWTGHGDKRQGEAGYPSALQNPFLVGHATGGCFDAFHIVAKSNGDDDLAADLPLLVAVGTARRDKGPQLAFGPSPDIGLAIAHPVEGGLQGKKSGIFIGRPEHFAQSGKTVQVAADGVAVAVAVLFQLSPAHCLFWGGLDTGGRRAAIVTHERGFKGKGRWGFGVGSGENTGGNNKDRHGEKQLGSI